MSFDGIRYILSFADPNKTENVVINVSYGPTTGPHDGTAELEAALTALVAEFDGIGKKPKLEIVLAAGNAYLSAGHIDYTRSMNEPDHIEWTWRLPPDNAVLCFAEVWIDNDQSRPCHRYAHIAQRSQLYIDRRSDPATTRRVSPVLHRGVRTGHIGQPHDVGACSRIPP